MTTLRQFDLEGNQPMGCKTTFNLVLNSLGDWYLSSQRHPPLPPPAPPSPFLSPAFLLYIVLTLSAEDQAHAHTHRLVGPVVKAFASRAEDPGFESHSRRDFSGSSHISDLKIGTPLATLPGTWRYRVRAGIGRPGVSILTC